MIFVVLAIASSRSVFFPVSTRPLPASNRMNASAPVCGALCAAAQDAAQKLGFQCRMLTDCLDCEAREAGRFLASIARSHQQTERPLAFFAGGETVVHLTGQGLGGRTQELALAAAPGLRGTQNTAVCSFGSDGTDGPTDAAGGFVDQSSDAALRAAGLPLRKIYVQGREGKLEELEL